MVCVRGMWCASRGPGRSAPAYRDRTAADDGLVQLVRVKTCAVAELALNVSDFYANMEQVRLFLIVWSVADMVDGYRKSCSAAEVAPVETTPGRIILGVERYPSSKELKGIVGPAGTEGRTVSERRSGKPRGLQLAPDAAPRRRRAISVARTPLED